MGDFIKEVKEIRVLLWSVFWLTVILGVSEYALAIGWPWRKSELEPYMLRKTNDDWIHNAFEIQRIKNRNPAKEREFFVFIGGSTCLEAITSDSLMKARMKELTGRQIGFSSLCSSYRSFSDDAKIVEELDAFGGTLLIGIEALCFRTSIDKQLTCLLETGLNHLKYCYLNTSPPINKVLSNYGLRIGLMERSCLLRTAKVLGEILKKKGLYFLDKRGEIQRLVHDRHAVGDKTPVNDEDRKKHKSMLRNMSQQYDRFYRMNLDLLKEVIDIAKCNGNRVFLIDMPRNPIYGPQIDRFNVHYDEMIRNLIKEKGVGYIDMRNAAQWTPEDFRDVHHLRSPGQIKFTEALAQYLAEDFMSHRSISDIL
jgi:hypothetical protein